MDMRERKRLAAVVAGAACVVLAVVSLGFVHPAQDGSWSLAWLFQTTADAPQGSADVPSEEEDLQEEADSADATDADGTDSVSDDSSDGPYGDSAGASSSAAGDDAGSDAGGAASSGGERRVRPHRAVPRVAPSVPGDGLGARLGRVLIRGQPRFRLRLLYFRAGRDRLRCPLCPRSIGECSEQSVRHLRRRDRRPRREGARRHERMGFTVNGGRVNVSASSCRLSDGDVVRWSYVTEAS